jgi:hypothetical protein
MRRGSSLAFLLALSLIASPAAAAPPAAPLEPDIVVLGRLNEVLRSFVGSMTQAGPTDQIARWKDDICPIVVGVEPAQADFMTQRILEVGRSVDLRTRRLGCVTTMGIIVTPDAAGVATELIRRFPISFRSDSISRMKRFVTSTKPVRWLSVTNECGDGCSLPNSRLVKATRPTFQAIIVIVDAQQIKGISLGELSDYVALVALSNPPAERRASSNSILSMFEGPRVPGSTYQLTDYDRSFLSGLYRSAMDKSAKAQRATIVSRMKKDVSGKAPPPKDKNSQGD